MELGISILEQDYKHPKGLPTGFYACSGLKSLLYVSGCYVLRGTMHDCFYELAISKTLSTSELNRRKRRR
jgi:hypothetical protein